MAVNSEKDSHRLKRNLIISLICNIVLVILAVPGAIQSMEGNRAAISFVFYTQDSNILLGIASVIYCIFAVLALKNRTYRIPGWVRYIKYISVCCITVTFTVVVFILAPMAREIGGLKWILFTGSMLFQHLLSPVIAIAEFLLFEHLPVLPFKATFIALIPTLVYAAVLYPLNIAGIVDGPYPFLQVRNMSVMMAVMWFFILLLISYFFAWLIWFVNKKIGHIR